MKRSFQIGLGLLFFPGFLLVASPSLAGNEAEVAELLVKLIQAGRNTIASNQALINDASKGHKGFGPEVFAEQTLQKFKEQTHIDLRDSTLPPQTAKLLLSLLESGKEVVAEFQPVINKQGIGFKGFIPAKWGRLTGEKFAQKTGIRLKLTSSNYRWPGNRPDEFEAQVLRMFEDPAYPKGKDYNKTMTVEGRTVFRLMAPEYAKGACLQCHGEPKGEKDITGMKKEGYREGDLAGAISLVIPIR